MIIPRGSKHNQFEDQIPDPLKLEPRWMGTRFEPRPDKPEKLNKPPYRVRSGRPVIKAAKTNPENWA